MSELSIPSDRRYTAEHIWVLEQGGELVLGVSDFAQDQLGEVQFVDLPSSGARFAAGADFGTIESIKSINALYMPVSGRITAVNSELEDNPALVNADCYGKGWIVRIETETTAETDALLDAEAYLRAIAG